MFMRSLIVLLSLLATGSIAAQYKNDNVVFKTVFPQDLCKALEENPGYLLLDVRSPGEFADTSSSTGLNLGHLSGAINIDIRQVGKRISEISAYKDKPVFVYCSHSQRSRRVSKMLADSGFMKVNNINGGMTAFYLLNAALGACLQSKIVSTNTYSIISPESVCRKLSGNSNDVYILDVRPDSAWNHATNNAKFNAYGGFKGTHHIELADMRSRLQELPRDKEIIITDLFGTDAALAARLLKENNFAKVAALLEGFDRWMVTDKTGWNCKSDIYVPAVSYKIITSPEFARDLMSKRKLIFLDVRSTEEFNNKHADSWRNIGHLENAINIPAADLQNRILEIKQLQSSPVVLYAFSSSPEVYDAANTLVKNGFTDVRVLGGGLFNLRWSASNMPGLYFVHGWVVDVPDENK
jgi:rhodanese-related sulfurtransferase